MRNPLTHRFGAHVPTAGGLAKSALPYLDKVGASVAQIFVSNPRGWSLSEGDPAQDEAFIAGCAERGVPVYIHASLLVNLGSPTAATVAHSAATLEHALRRGTVLGAKAIIFHGGSAVDEGHAPTALRQVRDVLLPLLDRGAEQAGPRVLVEPSAGGGRCLAARVEDLGPYFDVVDGHPWLGVCFDTCHAWAAGHDLGRPGGMTEALDTLVATVGAGRLGLVHANDSRDACGSLRDRHENIGAGTIGEEPFRDLVGHPATAGVPFVVETPGERHAEDIATLTRLATTPRPGSPTRARKPPRAAGRRRPD